MAVVLHYTDFQAMFPPREISMTQRASFPISNLVIMFSKLFSLLNNHSVIYYRLKTLFPYRSSIDNHRVKLSPLCHCAILNNTTETYSTK